MTEFIELFSSHYDYIFLFFMRISGLMISSPIFGRRNVPSLLKIGFCCMLTFLLVMGTPLPEDFVEYGTLLEYALICARELLFGVAMGFVATTMFNLAFVAGNLMDNQIGFSMVNVYDIQNNTQVPLLGNLLNVVMLIVFLMVNGHLQLIDMLQATVRTIPIGEAMPIPDIALVAVEVFTRSFMLAAMVAMPVVAAGLSLEVALGVLIKTVPQMNMFVVGIPLKLIVGMVVLVATMSIYVSFCSDIFVQMFEAVDAMFRTMAGTG